MRRLFVLLFFLTSCAVTPVPSVADQQTSGMGSGNSPGNRYPALSDEAALARLLENVELGPIEEIATPLDQPSPLSEGPDEQPMEAEQVQYLQPAGNISAAHCRGSNPQWILMPHGLIYGSYLAGAKESRFRGVWNNERNDGDIWDITLGGRAGLVRYGGWENGRPVGWQLDLEGAGLVRLDIDENYDVDAADFRFGVPLTWGDSRRQFKFAYYHLSSHLGDEFLLKNPGFPRLNYSRDVLVFGYSMYPCDLWRWYFEFGYGVATDVAKPWEFQFGVDYSPRGTTGLRGAPFAAVNGHLREEVDYGGNFVVQAGWAWRRSPVSGMFRTGVEYFNGKDDQFSFFDQSQQKVGFGLWYDY